MTDIKEAAVYTENMPMLALRGVSVFPNMLLNFDVERDFSVAAVNEALENNGQKIFMLTQKDIMKIHPEESDLYRVGTVCTVKQILRLPNSGVKIMVEGLYRAELVRIIRENGFFYTEVKAIEQEQVRPNTNRTTAIIRMSYDLFDEYRELSGGSFPENMLEILASDDPGYIADYIAQNMVLSHVEKQKLLEELRPVHRLEMAVKLLRREIEILNIEHRLAEQTQEQLIRAQKETVLREQLRVIQNELGEGDDFAGDIKEYKEKIEKLAADDKIKEKLQKEVGRLAKQPFGSSEAAVLKNYLDVCLELPWGKESKDRLNIDAVRKILDEDHFGLDKVKERIIEYLSVKKLAPNITGTILCLVGPPGTGKTSIAMSIARAMNRKLARVSLGGVHDEAEIRGHRKTYVGAMPGRIINAMTSAGTSNPLMLLDEIDKMGSDYRGDPASALLEALDGEQNSTFRDHFLEVPYDLSKVFFITTANTTDTIPRPLLDRMEIIELSSYTDEEKVMIAKEHLTPKQRKKHGLNGARLKINDDALRAVIAGYTRESGVRQLERQVAKLCRKTAAAIVSGEAKSVSVTPDNIEKYLGVRKFKPEAIEKNGEVGIVKGLAWTQVGGEILEVEVSVLDGSGKLELTGNLGDVMKESAKIAVSYIRSRAQSLGIDSDFYKNKDIHIHFPEGAVPKDGPSAGITMTVAVISALTGAPARSGIAMTGEVTLRGRILPIGGLKEKTMAAFRNGIKTVIIPAENESDLEDIDQTVRKALNFVTADNVDSILSTALDFSQCHRESGKLAEQIHSPLCDSKERGQGKVTLRQ